MSKLKKEMTRRKISQQIDHNYQIIDKLEPLVRDEELLREQHPDKNYSPKTCRILKTLKEMNITFDDYLGNQKKKSKKCSSFEKMAKMATKLKSALEGKHPKLFKMINH